MRYVSIFSFVFVVVGCFMRCFMYNWYKKKKKKRESGFIYLSGRCNRIASSFRHRASTFTLVETVAPSGCTTVYTVWLHHLLVASCGCTVCWFAPSVCTVWLHRLLVAPSGCTICWLHCLVAPSGSGCLAGCTVPNFTSPYPWEHITYSMLP